MAEAYSTYQTSSFINLVSPGPNSSRHTEAEFAHSFDEITFSYKVPTQDIPQNNKEKIN